MTQSNKENILSWLKVISVFLLFFVVLVPNMEIWNLASSKLTDGFHVVLSVFNLIFGGFSLYLYQKKIGAFEGLKKSKEKTDE